MADHVHSTIPSRRRFLVAAGALPAFVVAAAGDDSLIRLCRRWTELSAAILATDQAGRDIAALCAALGEVEECIVATPATSIAALRAKAGVAHETRGLDVSDRIAAAVVAELAAGLT